MRDSTYFLNIFFFFFQAEDGIRDRSPSRGLGDVYKRQLLIILVVVLLIFGPKNLPKLGKMFGKTMNNFKKGMEESEDEDATTAKAETKTEKKDDEE